MTFSVPAISRYAGSDPPTHKQASGLPASTLRFYEQKGLIASVGRAAGFSLNEIAAMFGVDGRPRIERQQLLEKADELDQSIKQLTAMRDGLRHAAACSAPSHLECPKFRRLMGLAGAGVIGERRNGASVKK